MVHNSNNIKGGRESIMVGSSDIQPLLLSIAVLILALWMHKICFSKE